MINIVLQPLVGFVFVVFFVLFWMLIVVVNVSTTVPDKAASAAAITSDCIFVVRFFLPKPEIKE